MAMPIYGYDRGLAEESSDDDKTAVIAVYANSFRPQQTRLTKHQPISPRLGFIVTIELFACKHFYR